MIEYKELFPFAIYARDTEMDLTLPQTGQEITIPVQCLLLLNRYTTPTGEEILTLLQDGAKKISDEKKPVGPTLLKKDKNDLERVLSELNTHTINSILHDCEEIVNNLPDDSAQRYARMIFAIIPSDMITPKAPSATWYANTISSRNLQKRGFGTQAIMEIEITDGLPLLNELEILLAHRVSNSKTLNFHGSCEHEEICAAVKILYGLGENIEMLEDISEQILETETIDAARTVLNEQINALAMIQQREKQQNTARQANFPSNS
ncbi:hypothetical protein HY486_01870 [Candidatus Woesearchaeota archaeon]|nr:hypothetical protein [Candidatus Woesearchaeota archaeon]